MITFKKLTISDSKQNQYPSISVFISTYEIAKSNPKESLAKYSGYTCNTYTISTYIIVKCDGLTFSSVFQCPHPVRKCFLLVCNACANALKVRRVRNNKYGFNEWSLMCYVNIFICYLSILIYVILISLLFMLYVVIIQNKYVKIIFFLALRSLQDRQRELQGL